MENNIQPQIRFGEFSASWIQSKLREVASFSKGAGYKKSDLSPVGDPIILYGRLYTKYQTVIEDVDTFVRTSEKSVISSGGEVIVPSSGESANDISRASVVASQGIILGGDLNIIRTNEEINSIFLALTISNGNQKQELIKRAQGKSVVHLHNSDLANIDLIYPKINEQQKIGTFFKQLDDTIALQQRQLERLKDSKQGFLQKMFPKDGERVPKVRFAGFSEDWKEYKFGELGSVVMNKRIFKSQTSEYGEVPFYKIGTFGKTPDAFISRSLFEEYKAKYPYPKIGDILISASGSIGRTVEYNGEDAYFQDSNIIWLEHDDRLLNAFLKQFYLIVEWQGVEGSTIKRLYNRNVLNTAISLPCNDEQQKIGSFFKQLDDTIALHKKELDLLKETKKAFLQKMFV